MLTEITTENNIFNNFDVSARGQWVNSLRLSDAYKHQQNNYITILQLSYLHNEMSHTWKTTSFH